MIAFCDMDDVLFDFNKQAFKALGLDYSYDPPALNNWHWHKYFGIPWNDMDSVCSVEFWATMDWMPDGRAILEIIEGKFDAVWLLTAPMPNPGAWTGKQLLIRQHLPQYQERVIMTRGPKSLLSGPDRILIDDNDNNVGQWREAGGVGILVPRPWNCLRNCANRVASAIVHQLEGA